MIRFLGHLLGGLLFLSLLAGAAWLWWPWLENAWRTLDTGRMAQSDPDRLTGAASSAVYLLDVDHWVEFPLPGQSGGLKVVSNAGIEPAQATQPEAEWLYALHYQLLDSSGRILRDSLYHHRTQVSWYRPPGSTQPLTAAFYPDGHSVPADGRLLLIDPAELVGATRLRLGLANQAPSVTEVVARVYTREHLFAPATTFRWNRIPRRQRDALGRASVHGPELLGESEQVNLLRQRWNPLGPAGVAGRDYRRQRLYTALDIEAEPLRVSLLPAGLYIDRALRATLPIAEPGGWVTLEFVEIPPPPPHSDNTIPTAGDVELIWHNVQPGPPVTYRAPLNGLSTTLWSEKLKAGLLEVVAPRPLVIRATQHQTTGPGLDLLPEPVYLRLYRLEPAQPLEFAIAHVGDQPTLWRVDLRLAVPDPAATTTVRYELLDQQDTALRQGTLAVAGTTAPYDRLIGQTTPFEQVSEPATQSFSLPATVVRVRLSAKSPVLVNAYTRPPDLRRELRIPEDYQPTEREKVRGQPVWFPVLPLAAQERTRNGQTALLVVQNRPPQRDPEILAGRYDWEDYYPAGPWRGRYVLNPRDPQAPARDSALATVFQPLTAGTPTQVELRNLPGRLTVEPSLLVLRDTDQPDTAHISIDGQPLFSSILTLRRSQLRLPPVPVGSHTLLVQTTRPARWFMNFLGGGSGSLTRRLAYRLDQQPLEFAYAKTSAGVEVLSGVLQMPASRQRIRLRATVATPSATLPGPFTRPTLHEWRYDIRPDERDTVPVLDTPAEQVGVGQRFFLPLGDDAPPGNYRIRFWLEEGGGYLTLYRVIAGLPAVLELFGEETQR